MLLNLIYGQQETTEKLDALMPDIHKNRGPIQIQADRPVLIKTHLLLSPAMPSFNLTAGFIYIVRNPMDVMLSNMNYAFRMQGLGNDPATRNRIRELFIERFINYRGDPNWIPIGIGSWVEHVTSWITNAPGFPCLILKYEDLLADPVAQLDKVSHFLKLHSSAEELQAAVENSSFERMKNIEEKELTQKIPGFYLAENTPQGIAEGYRFMFRGKAGAGEKEISPSQRERFLAQFGATIRLAGYSESQFTDSH